MVKTNAMRLLEQKKIDYKGYDYSHTKAVSGKEVADVLGLDYGKVFKTLVTTGKSREHYVFLVPVDRELSLKKAAVATEEKSIEMLKEKELLPLTGYVHGGCSPVGMKKQFKTFVDMSAGDLETIVVSGGKIGYQIELKVKDLAKIIPCSLADITTQ